MLYFSDRRSSQCASWLEFRGCGTRKIGRVVLFSDRLFVLIFEPGICLFDIHRVNDLISLVSGSGHHENTVSLLPVPHPRVMTSVIAVHHRAEVDLKSEDAVSRILEFVVFLLGSAS